MKNPSLKKTIVKIIIAAFVLPLTFVACNKDDDNKVSPTPTSNPAPLPTGNGESNLILTLELNGKPLDYGKNPTISHGLSQFIAIGTNGIDYPKSSITINFPDSLETGNYDLNDNSAVSVHFSKKIHSDTSNMFYLPTNGIFSIDKIDIQNSIFSGEFYFTAHNIMDVNDSVVISNGKYHYVQNF